MGAAPPLCADLGNRRLKLRVGAEVESFLWEEAAERARLAERLRALPAGPLWLSSSAPHALVALREQGLAERELRLVKAAEVPIRRATEGTGSDRLLVAWEAHAQSGGAVLVADCGSACTVDLVDAEGCFRGGAIAPGLSALVEALARRCPHLDAPAADEVGGAGAASGLGLPADTAAATRAGTLLALAEAVSGLGRRWEREAGLPEGSTPRVLTGGDAARLAPHLPDWRHQDGLLLDALARYAAAQD